MTSGKIRTREDIETIVNDLGYILLEEYADKNYRRVIIQDKIGYKYDTNLNALLRGHIPNFVSLGNINFSLENISYWLSLNKAEFNLCDDNIYEGATKKLIFYHLECQEFFEMSWNAIYSGNNGCPVCKGLQVGERTSLAYKRPDLAKEWDYEKNTFSPIDVTEHSDKGAWWICSTCKYSWFTKTIEQRTRKKKVNGCPACSGQVVSDRNRLSILFPEIAKEWHPTKNGILTPDDVSFAMAKKIWWICSEGHEYNSFIYSRTNGKGCEKCNLYKGEEKIEKFLIKNNIVYIFQKRFDNCRNKKPLPFDFGIPYENNSWTCIEHHGEQHYFPVEYFGGKEKFKEQKKLDKIKAKYCKENNIKLLIIPYWEFNNIEQILTKALLQ